MSMDDKYRIRESDYNFEKAKQLYSDKTVEELDKEWEEFKKKFKEEHKA